MTSPGSTSSSSGAAVGNGRSRSPAGVRVTWASTCPPRSSATRPGPGHARAAGAGECGVGPFAGASFDVVFCDHGAMTFADPDYSVPEVARVLRPAAASSSASRPRCESCASTTNGSRRRPSPHCVRHEAGHRRRVRRLRAAPRRVDPTVPPSRPRRRRPHRAAAAAAGDHDLVSVVRRRYEWASRWPAEEIWIVRKP